VYGSYYGNVEPFHQEQAVTQALIVMNDVEAALLRELFQPGISSEAECPGLGEDSQAAGAEFIEVDGVSDCGEVLCEGASGMIYA